MDYIQKNGFGGWFFWDTSFDDFEGSQCGQGKYPLLRAAVAAGSNQLLPDQSTDSTPSPEETDTKQLSIENNSLFACISN